MSQVLDNFDAAIASLTTAVNEAVAKIGSTPTDVVASADVQSRVDQVNAQTAALTAAVTPPTA